jgi:hypothetical protein
MSFMSRSMHIPCVLLCSLFIASVAEDSASNTMCPNLCRVPAGYEVAASGATLLRCAANHYNDGTGRVCTRCPSQSTFSAESGLTSLSECACRPGFHRVAGECTACDRGSYKTDFSDGHGVAGCKACPAHTSTPLSGSTNVYDCVCVLGFELVGGVCQKISCPAGSVLVVAAYTTSCQCIPGFGPVTYLLNGSVVCAPCGDGAFKDSTGNEKCSACGHNTMSTLPRANRTACACSQGFEAGLLDGPDVQGGNCVPECGPGEEGRHGLCVACKSGQFKNSVGQRCSSCPGARSSSPTRNTQENKCSCPHNTIEVESEDIAVIDRLGPLVPDSIESIIGVDSLLRASNTGSSLSLLRIDGAPLAVTVTVGGHLVFQCGRRTCAPTTVDLRGMHGLVNATAIASSTGGATSFTLLWYTRREVVLRGAAHMWWPAVAADAEVWAASGSLSPGASVFRTRSVFSSTIATCSPCPVHLVCAAHVR